MLGCVATPTCHVDDGVCAGVGLRLEEGVWIYWTGALLGFAPLVEEEFVDAEVVVCWVELRDELFLGQRVRRIRIFSIEIAAVVYRVPQLFQGLRHVVSVWHQVVPAGSTHPIPPDGR